MPHGYCGRIARIDLSSGRVTVEEPDELFYRRYLGGASFVAYFLLKELAPHVDALSPGNKLIFALGPVSGMPLPGSGRHCVGAKSPLTEGFGKSEAGGYWGAELKRAGWDALIVEGRASEPVYMCVTDDQIELRDARHLWGRDTKETQETIRAELGDRLVRVAQIGLAGENLVRIACIISDLRDSCGRTGMGAVMGSKNLKAIAVRGRRPQSPADPERIHSLARWVADSMHLARGFHEFGTGAAMIGHNLAGNLPVRNFRDGFFAETPQITAEAVKETIRVGMEGCYACPIRCKKVVRVATPFSVDPAYGGPEYETMASFGSNCGVGDLKAIAKAHELCHAYSLDTISTGSTVAFAMECFERGILTQADCDGLALRWGNGEAMVQLIEMIAHRQGIGDLLAEGSARAGRQLGRGAEELSMSVKGVEMGMHEPRLKNGLGLGYAVAAHGGDHATGLHDTAFQKAGPGLDSARALGILEPMPAGELSSRKARLFAYLHTWRQVADSLIFCYFVPYDYSHGPEMLGAATGWQTSLWELMKVGERAIAMARAFNVREGLTVDADRLPQRFFSGTTEGALKSRGINAEEFNQTKKTLYGILGWDPITGRPLASKLHELDLGWLAAELYGV